MATADLTSLRRRLSVMTCVFVAFVLFASGLSGLMIRSWDRTLDARSEARTASSEVSDLRAAFNDKETGIHGYLLTRDPTFLDPYRDGDSIVRAMIQRIGGHQLAHQVEIDAQLARVGGAAARWTSDVGAVAVDDAAPAPDDEVVRVRSETLRTELDRLDRLVSGELRQAEQRSNMLKRNTFGVLIASSLVALVATALIAMLFRRWVTRPLAAIAAWARHLAADEDADPPDFDSAELQEVAESLLVLHSSLATERDRALMAYAGLEQSAVLALHVRAELADELGELPDGWSLASALQPAEGLVAGDCFDVGLLDQHRMYVIVIDVTGHGAEAALSALKAKSQLRAALRTRLSPNAAVEWLSRENRSDELADLLTALVVVIDIESGECSYANAGHPGPLLVGGEQIEMLPQTGPLVGAFPATWDLHTFTIAPGNTLVVYTDGIIEALGADRERFGIDRLRDGVSEHTDSDPDILIESILSSLEQFEVGSHSDDVTLLAVRRTPRADASNADTTTEADTAMARVPA
jgi:serine phosphatase RsbU (regulator of sigma subunit)/CHASE3 domain sensor protein